MGSFGWRGSPTLEEQNALRKGCLDALTIDNAVAEEVRVYRRNLSVAWINYQKVFDTPQVSESKDGKAKTSQLLPIRWINKMLKAIRAPKPVRRTIRKLIPMWATDILAQTEDGTVKLPIAF